MQLQRPPRESGGKEALEMNEHEQTSRYKFVTSYLIAGLWRKLVGRVQWACMIWRRPLYEIGQVPSVDIRGAGQGS